MHAAEVVDGSTTHTTSDLEDTWKAEYEAQVQSWRAQSAEAREKAEKERLRWESVRAIEKEEATKRKAAGIADEPPKSVVHPVGESSHITSADATSLNTVSSETDSGRVSFLRCQVKICRVYQRPFTFPRYLLRRRKWDMSLKTHFHGKIRQRKNGKTSLHSRHLSPQCRFQNTVNTHRPMIVVLLLNQYH